MTPPNSASPWYRVSILSGESGTKAAILQNDFETLYTINGTPNGAAMFAMQNEKSGTSPFLFLARGGHHRSRADSEFLR